MNIVPARNTLSARRHAETFAMTFWEIRWQVTIGYYDDYKTPGEVFINGTKSGTQLEASNRDGAILLSLAIQHGVPLATIKAALTRNEDNTPSTLLGAIVDQIAGT